MTLMACGRARFLDAKLDRLAGDKPALVVDGRVMHEYIVALLGLNIAKPRSVKPTNGALMVCRSPCASLESCACPPGKTTVQRLAAIFMMESLPARGLAMPRDDARDRDSSYVMTFHVL
jgi:hypothetical protein